jgi:hypothetical protein
MTPLNTKRYNYGIDLYLIFFIVSFFTNNSYGFGPFVYLTSHVYMIKLDVHVHYFKNTFLKSEYFQLR